MQTGTSHQRNKNVAKLSTQNTVNESLLYKINLQSWLEMLVGRNPSGAKGKEKPRLSSQRDCPITLVKEKAGDFLASPGKLAELLWPNFQSEKRTTKPYADTFFKFHVVLS